VQWMSALCDYKGLNGVTSRAGLALNRSPNRHAEIRNPTSIQQPIAWFISPAAAVWRYAANAVGAVALCWSPALLFVGRT
jgi:hypothetical protein